MGKTSVTIIITITVLLIFLILLLSVLPWLAAALFTLLLLIVWLLILASVPQYFLTDRAAKADGNDSAVMATFTKMLRDVFSPDTVLISTNTSRQYQILIDKKTFLIGRSSQCNYVLKTSKKIGRKQACIQYNEGAGGYYVCDLGSTNGTLLNGIRIEPNRAYPLEKGDTLALADVLFVVRSAYY